MSSQVVFLCTGNTCRSPLAEVLARDHRAWGHLVFGSAGLQVQTGDPASAESLAVAGEMGLDLAAHRARPVSPQGLATAAWVIGLTRSHAALFRARARGFYAGAVGVLGLAGVDLAPGGFSPATTEDVDDPYGSDLADYRRAAARIRHLLEAWDDVFRNLKGIES